MCVYIYIYINYVCVYIYIICVCECVCNHTQIRPIEAELFHADGQTDAINKTNLAVTLRIFFPVKAPKMEKSII